MRCLTIRQPWASLIAAGLKPIENRTWPTRYRGPLLIHVSAKLGFRQHDWETFCRHHPEAAGLQFEDLAEQCGRIICQVELVDCVPVDRLPDDLRSHWCCEGPICWIIHNPIPFAGTPKVKGKLGVWEYTPVSDSPV